ncbi:hypothetical protein, partial [Paenibacillus cucumis (ex Kampfer et al. 2016)]|uniref:hypothetical protein n=1 Tax=Paenibacillus cucumis (ex Kampfer et al. 2016) TaxID=1776858 RepID=UPI001C8D411F
HAASVRPEPGSNSPIKMNFVSVVKRCETHRGIEKSDKLILNLTIHCESKVTIHLFSFQGTCSPYLATTYVNQTGNLSYHVN